MRKLILLILLIVLIPVQANKPMLGVQIDWSEPLSKGIVGYWLMNEGAGNIAQDLSGNGNTGTFNGAATWLSDKFGPTVDFVGDAAEYITLANAISFGNTDRWTVIFRVLADTNANSDGVIGNNTDSVHLVRLAEGALLRFTSADGTADWAAVQAFTTMETYALVAYGDNTISLYKNGVLVSTVDMSPKHTAFNITHFGRVGAANTYDLDGQISYVSIYNLSLSASELALLYRKPFAMFTDNQLLIMQGAQAVAAPGQVISIQFASMATPVFMIGGLTLLFSRKKK